MKPGSRILVVDDNEAAATSLAKLLSLRGYTVETCFNGEDAVKAALSFKPAAAILDIGLPDMTGYDLCKMLHAQGYEGASIALTGFGQDSDRTEAEHAGFDFHLVKPAGLAEIEAVFAQIP